MNRTVSYSELDTIRQCRFKHQLAYQELWVPDGEEAEALSRGTLFHSVMEAHYGALQEFRARKEPGTAADVVEKLVRRVMPLLHDTRTGFQTDRQELVEWMYRGYVDLYGLDLDWEIVAIEKSFEFWLPNERGNRTNFKLAGTADLIVKDWSAGGGLWIVDHKTCRNLPRQKDFDMEDQTAIYTYLMKRAGLNIRGAIYNHCRTERLKTREMGADERFKRTLTVRDDEELREMALEALDHFREAYKPRTRHAPRTPDGERCGWKCNFTEPCLASRKRGNHQAILQNFGFHQADHKPGPTFTRLAEEAAKKSTVR